MSRTVLVQITIDIEPVMVYDYVTNASLSECVLTLAGHAGSVKSAVFSPDGLRVSFVLYASLYVLWGIGKRDQEQQRKGLTFLRGFCRKL